MYKMKTSKEKSKNNVMIKDVPSNISFGEKHFCFLCLVHIYFIFIIFSGKIPLNLLKEKYCPEVQAYQPKFYLHDLIIKI